MGIAYSGSNIVYTTIRCDTSANIRADIDAALVAAGITTKSTVTNGYKYTLISPQNLKCKVVVQDNGETVSTGGVHYTVINVQLFSLDETLVGFKHQLIFGATTYSAIGYEMQAGICQFFIALKGVADQTDLGGFGNSRNYSVACGIPFVPAPVAGTECALSGGPGPATTQIFWSCGMGAFNFDFRNARLCDTTYCYCLNAKIFTWSNASPSDTNYTGGLRIYPLTPTLNIDNTFGQWSRVIKYSNHDPLYVDAFVGWNFAIQGQLWDAFQATRDETLDSTITLTQTDSLGNVLTSTWLAWNHYVHDIAGIDFGDSGTFWSTLYLLIVPSIGKTVSNYAY